MEAQSFKKAQAFFFNSRELNQTALEQLLELLFKIVHHNSEYHNSHFHLYPITALWLLWDSTLLMIPQHTTLLLPPLLYFLCLIKAIEDYFFMKAKKMQRVPQIFLQNPPWTVQLYITQMLYNYTLHRCLKAQPYSSICYKANFSLKIAVLVSGV